MPLHQKRSYASKKTKRQALGQHFLRDTRVIGRILETVFEQAKANQIVDFVEIGPGRGALTFPFTIELTSRMPGQVQSFKIFERDRELVDFWKSEQSPSITGIFEGDFMDQPQENFLLPDRPVGVFSNLPYSAGTAIFTRLANHPDQIRFMVLMFQAEVAQRIRAEVGTKAWGSLSLFSQNLWKVSKLISVAPGAFVPPPEVQSEVILLEPRSEPLIPGTDPQKNPEGARLWEDLLRVAFQHRRKMLRGGLPSTGPWKSALEKSQVPGTKRAEALSWEEWKNWFDCLVS
ncbi:MAG: ribosomal RNA small subunit methyltransferase A [Bdellovibrionales bacterium]|nr:ribosomal RNA small subunit methyltransferase A [Bdellovibrionales bacterium]